MKIKIVLVIAMALSGLLASAQSTARIQGAILDTSGSAIPGAEITATQTATGVNLPAANTA